MIPVLECRIGKRSVKYRWQETVKGLKMPAVLLIDGQKTTIHPKNGRWNKIKLGKRKIKEVSADKNYLIIPKITSAQ
jgi:hypothetical protein